MPKPNKPNRPQAPPVFDEQLYHEAEAFQAQNADDLRGMALLAYKHRNKPAHLRQLSFQWARDARRMAAAVARWPTWFLPTDNMPAKIVEVDEAITLFGLASLPEAEALPIMDQWQAHSWRSWQVKEFVDHKHATEAEERSEVQRLTVDGVVVREIGRHTLILGIPSHKPLAPELEALWSGATVRLLLVLTPAKTGSIS